MKRSLDGRSRALAELSADATLPPAKAGSRVRITPPPRIPPPPVNAAGRAAAKRRFGRGRPGPRTLAAFAVAAVVAAGADLAMVGSWIQAAEGEGDLGPTVPVQRDCRASPRLDFGQHRCPIHDHRQVGVR